MGRRKSVVILALLASLAVACSSAPPPATQAPATAAPATAAAAAPAKAAQFTFKLGHVVEETSPMHLATKQFADVVAQKSDGRIKIDIYPLSQLGSDLEVVQAMQQGSVEMGNITTSLFVGIEPKWALFTLPFLFKDRDHGYRVFESNVGQQMFKLLEPKGIKGMYFGDQGFFVIMSKDPISSPDDMKAKKVRVVPDPVNSALMQSLGAIPTPMSWGEVYPALQQGTIDGLVASVTAMLTGKMYEVAKNMAVTNHQMVIQAVVMSQKTWNQLPPDLQQVMSDASKQGATFIRDLTTKRYQEDLGKLKQLGVQVRDVNQQPFRDRVQPVYRQFEGQIGKDLIDAAMAIQ